MSAPPGTIPGITAAQNLPAVPENTEAQVLVLPAEQKPNIAVLALNLPEHDLLLAQAEAVHEVQEAEVLAVAVVHAAVAEVPVADRAVAAVVVREVRDKQST